MEGWGKNLASSSTRTAPGPLAAMVPWLLVSGLFFFWLLPPLVLVRGALGLVAGPWVPAAAVARAASLGFSAAMYRREGQNPLYAALVPLGALVMAAIIIRGLTSGGRVTWIGRRYSPALRGRHAGLNEGRR